MLESTPQDQAAIVAACTCGARAPALFDHRDWCPAWAVPFTGRTEAQVAPTRLACGHDEEIAVGERLWCHYDVSFGVVIAVGPDGWHDLVMDGSPYKAAGSHGSYDRDRLACVPCGLRDLARRRNDRLVVAQLTWEVVRP
jgi:hypothetical protein